MTEVIPTFETDAERSVSSCAFAETSFEKVFSDFLAAGLARGPQGYGFDVFTQDNVPILLRKSHNYTPSSISFTDIAIEDRIYPAGSLFRVDTARDHPLLNPKAPVRSRVIRPLGEITAISFLRRSGFVAREGACEERLALLSDVERTLSQIILARSKNPVRVLQRNTQKVFATALGKS